MRRLQDLDGYPDKLDINEVVNSDFPNDQIRDWAIDLLAAEAERWIDYEDQTTADFAMAIIASCRPMMETMAMKDGMECDQGVLTVMVGAHLALARALVDLKRRRMQLFGDD